MRWLPSARIGPSIPRKPTTCGGSNAVISEVAATVFGPSFRRWTTRVPTEAPLGLDRDGDEAILPLGLPREVGDVGEDILRAASDLD
jgi:hypothetical protein